MSVKSNNKQLILGSTSPFRKEILAKLGLPFDTAAPNIDEAKHDNEKVEDYVLRLSEQKAQAVSDQFPHHLIIGSDQAALLDGEVLGKPGNHEKAFMQLTRASGKSVVFYTGLCLYDSEQQTSQKALEIFTVHFRKLSAQQINNYLEKEQPLDCAGSFKSEGLGIALFTKLEGDDPNTLIGLPLIRLIQFLENKELAPI